MSGAELEESARAPVSLAIARAERERLSLEVDALIANRADPDLINRTERLLQLGELDVSEAEAAEAAAQLAERAAADARLLDSVADSQAEHAAATARAIAPVPELVADIIAAVNAEQKHSRYLIDELSSRISVENPRFQRNPPGIRVDGQLVARSPRAAWDVLAAVVPVAALVDRQLADRILTAARIHGGRPIPTPKGKPA
jgi:hypothetical protein